MVVAVEVLILSSLILMRQNRMLRRGEGRDHLNLHIDLLVEKEITTLLQMVRSICGHMGLQSIAADKEIRELTRNTSIESLEWLSRTLEDGLGSQERNLLHARRTSHTTTRITITVPSTPIPNIVPPVERLGR